MPEPTATELKTEAELLRSLAPFGLTDLGMGTQVTSADRIQRKAFPLPIFNAVLGIAHGLTGYQFRWFRGITARKI